MSDFFCPLPWIHQFIQQDGIKPCCSSTLVLAMGPREFENSQQLSLIKKDISNGGIPESCQGCARDEALGLRSTRLSALDDFPNYNRNNVPDRIEYLDLRYKNTCNFSCRTCNPQFSSMIDKELTANSHLKEFYPAAGKSIHNNIVDSIEHMIPNLTRINLTGGEPLLIKENLEVLERLLPHKDSVQILITTNASVINNRILNLLQKYKNVHWTISLDAVGHKAEYIRNGTEWNKVSANVIEILNLSHSSQINCTVSCYSILGLRELAEYYCNLRNAYGKQPLEISFYAVQHPDFLSPEALPLHLAKDAIQQIDDSLILLKGIENITDKEISSLSNMKNMIGIKSHLANKFIQFTQQLDGIRNQSFREVFGIGTEER